MKFIAFLQEIDNDCIATNATFVLINQFIINAKCFHNLFFRGNEKPSGLFVVVVCFFVSETSPYLGHIFLNTSLIRICVQSISAVKLPEWV